ncbi:MAG: hypothetical protein AAGI23_02280 [Bacteroidota bacterium]
MIFVNKIYFIAALSLLTACAPIRYFGANLFNTSSYERYVTSLKKAGMAETSMGEDWLAAGARALTDTNYVNIPLDEIAYFASNRIDAKSYRFELEKGRNMEVEIKTFPRDLLLFIDLFEYSADTDKYIFVPIQKTDDRTYTYNIKQSGEFVLRVQPQILTGGRYGIRIK